MRRTIDGLRGDDTLPALLSSRIQASSDATARGRETIEAMEHMLRALSSLRHELSDTAPLKELKSTRHVNRHAKLTHLGGL